MPVEGKQGEKKEEEWWKMGRDSQGGKKAG